jgi:methionyl-tRNA formyltransferase
MLDFYKVNFPIFPVEPSLFVGDINESSVIDLINQKKPDLVVVSGTNLLRNEIISTIHRYGRVINLHTGISPYIKGGPNCTNWCLYLKDFGLIGNTVMWLDEGIDSGNIIATEKTNLTGKESLLDLHIKVMDHAHDLYLRVIFGFIGGKPLKSIAQKSMSPSRLFLSKHWGPKQMMIATFNFYLFYKPGSKYFNVRPKLKLISLN